MSGGPCHLRYGTLKNPHWSVTIWVPSIGQNLQPLTGNGGVSIWAKSSRVGRKTSIQIRLYHPLVYILCIVIISGLRSNDAVAKHSKQRRGILKWNEESTSSVFQFIGFYFYLKMSHYIYHMSSMTTIPEFQPLRDMKALACYFTFCLLHRVV